MYRSRWEDRISDADLAAAAGSVVCARAEESTDTQLNRSISGTQKCGKAGSVGSGGDGGTGVLPPAVACAAVGAATVHSGVWAVSTASSAAAVEK